jgi:hypothetical protein
LQNITLILRHNHSYLTPFKNNFMEQAEKPKELKVSYRWGGEREFDLAPLLSAATTNPPEHTARLIDEALGDLMSYYCSPISGGPPRSSESIILALRGYRNALLEGAGKKIFKFY